MPPIPSEPTPALPRRKASDGLPPAPYLYLALHCEAPLQPSSGHCLADVDVVSIGRGDETGWERVVEGGERRLVLRVADRWLSAAHVRLRRDGERFLLEDCGSKNGTLVNGARCERAELGNYDVVEAGRTLFLFRAGVPRREGDPLDARADALPEPAPRLRTFVGPLALQFSRLKLIAGSTVPTLILGETGTGKELVARALHEASGRAGPFVGVNCGALAPTLLEAELFGHRKGAFTGAAENRPGLVRSADGGTLFLDEVGDLSHAGQTALLRVLQEAEVLSVGASEPVKVDVRVLAATHQSLPEAIARGRFRADLFARLSGFTLTLPPLRWRREDLGILVAALLRAGGEDAGRLSFTPEAGTALLRYRWPLNVRELEKCLTAARVLCAGEPIDLAHLPAALSGDGDARREATDPRFDLASTDEERPRPPLRPLDEAERRHRDELIALLREHHGNVAAVGRVLGKGRMQIHRWVRRYELRLDDFR